jgi:hypothetical protein
MVFGDGSQGFAQVGVWVDGVQFAGFDERGDDGPFSSAFVGSSVMIPGVWVLTRLSRIRFTRFAAKQLELQDRLTTTFVVIF